MFNTIRKGFFAGSGSAALSELSVCDYILQLTGKFTPSSLSLEQSVHVLYLGTATYDLQGPRENQTKRFKERGCSIVDVSVADFKHTPPHSTLAAAFRAADVVIVSGGNTLFAIRRWKEVGVDEMIREAAARGAVMTGGSAGAICWFDGGHSDSMDADTYRSAMINEAAQSSSAPPPTAAPLKDEASVVGEGAAPKPWKYIRVSCLGLLPGLVCPHHDRTQSNGRPRYEDFDEMMLRHSGERGIVIDHWAALVVVDGEYHVFATPGKEGSCVVVVDGEEGHKFVTDGSGIPAVWWKEVAPDETTIVRHPVPFQGGLLRDLLKVADRIVVDPLEAVCAAENPTQY